MFYCGLPAQVTYLAPRRLRGAVQFSPTAGEAPEGCSRPPALRPPPPTSTTIASTTYSVKASTSSPQPTLSSHTQSSFKHPVLVSPASCFRLTVLLHICFLTSAAMDEEQIATMKKVFQMFDQGKTGFVECSKFVNILNTLGQAFDEDELKNRIAENDPNKEGKVDFEKFCAIVMPFLEEDDDEAMHEELKEAFRLYDKGGDGYITTQTLKEILRELDNKLSEEDLDGIIDEIDEDGSGTVDFDEFMEMMTGE
ncbi:troponin C, isotype gamma-like isoform X1 [Scylla paramamosain]|uniref:troponin C, isotype gamma-like isoform X1 n=1 Tax=Scylla paramamosain TaxID=85552 RepID=UPI003082B961